MTVYQENKAICAHCSLPINDSERREQRAGKVYHTKNPDCLEAYHRAKEGS